MFGIQNKIATRVEDTLLDNTCAYKTDPTAQASSTIKKERKKNEHQCFYTDMQCPFTNFFSRLHGHGSGGGLVLTSSSGLCGWCQVCVFYISFKF